MTVDSCQLTPKAVGSWQQSIVRIGKILDWQRSADKFNRKSKIENPKSQVDSGGEAKLR
ncbi:MAG: hypothetical protein JGK24_21315 [Microcoleus sp. PH2017_29_MFU_D_A]|uniref:hypothetical protein n=1 Tax=unclassified Microcoleus TaxID=2642155 RepID=UPI001D1EC7E8|nr:MULTISPECIES: hypothetical protein [unclassified Microcoleus]MCC3430447.1 hypothetical protein [Microcoleus sp. PH2017_04_SCI_O_A]MCC3466169.1 hypothetical protein [Microcoleus sp. PH2017_06_SFM_O_A]MCC3550767.1 hypothetical protein [Microcoleus sp. PH2017_24_DOB_U_A]MCC3425584.1 hypothetical protein [Microcoleus sp. PH2017_01_SCD_O_A]MCC3438997.1 hypothetical protein [Microcoleus sp. PH2017_05_CCC_O_A]